MIEFKSAAGIIWHHTKILMRGFKRVLCGTATAGLIGLAVYGFVMIPGEGGYIAVCDFLASSVTLGMAMLCAYQQGCNRKRGNRK